LEILPLANMGLTLFDVALFPGRKSDAAPAPAPTTCCANFKKIQPEFALQEK
jgi:hypothetical protein